MRKIIYITLSILSTVCLTNLPANAELTINSPTVSVNDAQNLDLQTATDESLVELLKVMRMDSMMEAMTQSQGDMMAPIMESIVDEMGIEEISDIQRQELTDAFTRYSNQTFEQSNDDLLAIAEKHFVSVGKKYYNQAEVDALISFYSSAVGQSVLDKQPKMVQDYTMAIMPEVVAVIGQHQEERFSQLIDDIEKILD